MSTTAITPNPTDNPFDTPLPSEVKEHQQASAATVASGGNPFDDPLPSEKADIRRAQSGQVTNDVGNTVFVPKDGESFSDTMARAAAQGKVTNQDQINKEMASAPSKIAETIAAAPAIGFGGAAALAAPGALYDAAVTHLDQLTKVVRAARALGWTSFGLKEAHDIFKMVAPDNKK